jgi:thiol-disulfide isomerase/thioredoxin
MRKSAQFALAAIIAVGAAAAGYALNAWWRADAEAEASAALLSVQLTDLNGKPRSIDAWRGRVLVVNFWATWCTPCREEIPVFVRLQRRHGARGLQLIGVAIDQREQVDAFVRDFGINYPVLLGSLDAVEISRRAGNRRGALPFTLMIDRSGRLVGTHLGIVKEAKLEALLESLL